LQAHADKLKDVVDKIDNAFQKAKASRQRTARMRSVRLKLRLQNGELAPEIHQSPDAPNMHSYVAYRRKFQKEIEKPYRGYKFELPDGEEYPKFDRGSGRFREFIDEHFKGMPWIDPKKWADEHPEVVASTAALLWKGMRDHLQNFPDDPENFASLVPDEELTAEEILAELRDRPDKSIAKKAIKVFGIQLEMQGLNHSYKDEAMSEEEQEVMRGLLEEAMEQSEIFSQLLQRTEGLPFMQLLKPHPPKPTHGNKSSGTGDYEHHGAFPSVISPMGSQFLFLVNMHLAHVMGNEDGIDGEPHDKSPTQVRHNVTSSAHGTLRHEFGHWFDHEPEFLSQLTGLSEEDAKIIATGFAEIRKLAEEKVKSIISESEVQQMLAQYATAIGEIRAIVAADPSKQQSGVDSLGQLVDLIHETIIEKLITEFSWLSRYGMSDTFHLSNETGRLLMSMGPQNEFIAELFALATSSNKVLLEDIPSEYMQVFTQMFSQLGIKFP
jgi:hypothetical protein